MTPPTGSHAPRNAGLDVVRAVAIVLVLVGHCGAFFAAWYGVAFPWQLAVGGFYGVELFFVLSGLLIGRILIGILDAGPTWRAWRVFMTRRWMRTLPVYFLWLAVLALVWPPPDRGLWTVLPWYLTMTQNLGWGMVSDWYGVSWSLTVEEWFYLLFSGLLFAAAALAGRRAALPVTLGLFLVVPVALRWHMVPSLDWDHVIQAAVIYRLDAIAFGVGLAWISIRRPRALRHHGLLLLLGLLLIGAAWHAELDRLPLHVRQTFIFDWVSLGFALCLPAAMAARWRGLRWLLPGAAALSRQSYAIYITHLSLLEFVGHFKAMLDMPATISVAVSVVAILGLSYASYRWIEAPILAMRPRQAMRAPGAAGWVRATRYPPG